MTVEAFGPIVVAARVVRTGLRVARGDGITIAGSGGLRLGPGRESPTVDPDGRRDWPTSPHYPALALVSYSLIYRIEGDNERPCKGGTAARTGQLIVKARSSSAVNCPVNVTFATGCWSVTGTIDQRQPPPPPRWGYPPSASGIELCQALPQRAPVPWSPTEQHWCGSALTLEYATAGTTVGGRTRHGNVTGTLTLIHSSGSQCRRSAAQRCRYRPPGERLHRGRPLGAVGLLAPADPRCRANTDPGRRLDIGPPG
jgi:hypothetical protein